MPWNASFSCWPRDPLPQRPEVVAEVDVAGRLDARQHPGHAGNATMASPATEAIHAWRSAQAVSLAGARTSDAVDSARFAGSVSPRMAIDASTADRCRDPGLRGPVRPAPAADPGRGGRPLRGQPGPHRRRLPGRDRADAGRSTSTSPPSSCSSPPRSSSSRPAACCPGRADVDLDDELALWEERDLLLARLLECKTFKDVAARVRHARRRRRPQRRPTGRARRALRGLAPDLLAGLTPLPPPRRGDPRPSTPQAGAADRPVPRRPDPGQRRRRRRRAGRRAAAGRAHHVRPADRRRSSSGSR